MPKINLYRNISISFLVFTVVILIASFFVFSSKAVILVTPNENKVELSFNVEAKSNPSPEELSDKDVVKGSMTTLKKTASSTYAVSTTQPIAADGFLGKVRLINNSERNQTLVKTTQLQSANGVIVRTAETVVVPAKGNISVDVYPKDKATFSDVEPGELKIIKLLPASQALIYGVNDSILSNSPREAKIVSVVEVEKAKAELKNKILTDLAQELDLADASKLSAKVVAATVNPIIGSEADNFKLNMSVEVNRLVLDEDQLYTLIRKKIKNLNLEGVDVADLNKKDLSYQLQDVNAGVMNVKVKYDLSTKINKEHELLAVDTFTGKSVAEVKELLSDDMISDVSIKVSPYWRQVLPKQARKIQILVSPAAD